jgi:uncharacterized repeat protein (TIGR03847 family)
VVIDLDPVDRITADAVGPPGARTFYLQGRRGQRVITVVVEKQQVQLLAASVVEILARLGKETGEGPPEESMGLEEPIVPEWRAGRLSIGYAEERDLILLEVEELVADGEEDEEEEGVEGLALEFGTARLGEETEEDLEDGSEWDDELAELEDLEGLAETEALAEAAGLETDPGEEAAEEPSRVRFWATREQMLSLARHGASVCAQGRPRCQLCGNPIDPEGHQCPALNGHRESSA